MKILGISPLDKDATASLVDDGEILGLARDVFGEGGGQDKVRVEGTSWVVVDLHDLGSVVQE